MPKLVYILYPNPDLSHDEFVRHYRAVHSPLAVEGMPLQTAYSANLADVPDAVWARAGGVEPQPSPIGSIAFLKFDDISVLSDPDRLYADKEFEERLTADGEYLFSGMHGYVIDEVVQWDVERTWPLGEVTPGINQISMVRKLPELDRAQFREHYEHKHGPLARIHHPGIWRYTQNFVVDAITPDAPPIDAFSELHFRTEEDFHERYYRDEESKVVIAEDVARFLDRSTTVTVQTRETIWID